MVDGSHHPHELSASSQDRGSGSQNAQAGFPALIEFSVIHLRHFDCPRLNSIPLQESTSRIDGADHSRDSQPIHTPTPAERFCRICLSKDGGRLFSPCYCRGTMQFVHVACLNEWRYMSRSTTAFLQCDQCGYRYDRVRTRAATVIEHPLIAPSVSVFAILIMAITIGSIVCEFQLADWIYKRILFWIPPWRSSRCRRSRIFNNMILGYGPQILAFMCSPKLGMVMDTVISGLVVVGCLCFVVAIYSRFREDPRVLVYGVGGMMASSSFNSNRFLRVAFCLGISWGFYEIYRWAVDISRKALIYCGERLLEIGERERLAQLSETTQTGEHQHRD